jgi:hypothetical protein
MAEAVTVSREVREPKQSLSDNDNTKPSVRVGRKAHRVSWRQPGCRNIAKRGPRGTWTALNITKGEYSAKQLKLSHQR